MCAMCAMCARVCVFVCVRAAAPQAALENVLRLPSVCSKRFLTTKVDRHVTGASARAHVCARP
jgi:phosphoribosylformylglycinamidine (FGAM) synthase-like enzyme